MTPLFPARRSAERFDSLLEGSVEGARVEVDPRTADLLELVGALRTASDVQPRAEFVSDLRERLMLAATTELKPVPRAARDDVARLTVQPARTRREHRIGVAIGAFAIVGATGSMAVASQGAIPGDALYPVKRAIENTQAGFTVGDDAKGETILGNASTRLDEVDQLSQQKDPDAQLVTETLDTFVQQFSDGSNSLLADYETTGNTSSIKHLHQNAQSSVLTLANLEGLIPPAAHGALVDAAATVIGLDAQAQNLCPSCGDGVLDLPAVLASASTAAQQSVDGLGTLLAGGQVAGTTPPSEAPTDTQTDGTDKGTQGGKHGGKPSTMNPPETPITLPTTPSDATGPLGNVLPGGGNANQGSGGSSGNHGGKHKPDPVKDTVDTVNQVVNGVVDGVAGVLNGLTGGLTGGTGG